MHRGLYAPAMRGILLKIAEDKPEAAVRFVDRLEEHVRIQGRGTTTTFPFGLGTWRHEGIVGNFLVFASIFDATDLIIQSDAIDFP